MINKLKHYGGQKKETSENAENILSALEDKINSEKSGVIQLGPSGRGSYTFIYNTDTDKRFLKVNFPDNYSKNMILKEKEILSLLYGSDFVRIIQLNNFQYVLDMKYVDGLQSPMEMETIKEIIRNYQDQLEGKTDNLSGMYDISDLYEEYLKERACFFKQGYLSKDTMDALQQYDMVWKEQIESQPRIICHGDLGNANLMSYQNKITPIDWEDAFWGVRDYDYIFWLSFFSQRRLYTPTMFITDYQNPQVNLAMMLMIVVLKEAMNLYTGQSINNTLSIEQRINELLSYAEVKA